MTLQDLVRTHLAIVAMLSSTILSPATRQQLEVFCTDIENEIAEIKARESEPRDVAAD
jgi:hypothetical protein